VLKGHIGIATARFPKGTRGIDLDPFARRALWQAGLDFDHGTGHGIGSYLSVHEGPQSISKRGMTVLEAGMIISNEPGYYKEGAYGIRIENLVLVSEPEKALLQSAYWDAQGDAWHDLRESVLSTLRRFHADEPLKPGMARETLRAGSAQAMPPEAFRELIQALAADAQVRVAGDRVAMADHRVVLSPEDAARADKIEAAFRRAGIDPPPIEDVLRECGGPHGSRLKDWLVAEGKLVRIRDGRLFHGEALEDLRRKLRDFSRTSSTIEIGTFKELAGATRKNAIPLLEQFDEERLTRREGNVRRILTNDAAR
jgi:hypothetical protein